MDTFIPSMFAIFGIIAFAFGFMLRIVFVVISRLLGKAQSKPGLVTIAGSSTVFVGASFFIVEMYFRQVVQGSGEAGAFFLITLAIGAFFFVMTLPVFFVGLYAAGPLARALARGLVRLPGWLARQAREGH